MGNALYNLGALYTTPGWFLTRVESPQRVTLFSQSSVSVDTKNAFNPGQPFLPGNPFQDLGLSGYNVRKFSNFLMKMLAQLTRVHVHDVNSVDTNFAHAQILRLCFEVKITKIVELYINFLSSV